MGTCKMKFLCLLRVHFIKKRKIDIALHCVPENVCMIEKNGN